MLNEIAKDFTINANSKGQSWDWKSTPTALMLIVTEAAEAMESWRDDDKKNFGEELADIVIRVSHLSYELEIDLDKEIITKHERNKTRDFKHGRKRL